MHAMSFLDELSSLMFLLAGLAQPNKNMPQSLMPRYCPAGTNTFQYFTWSVFRSTLSRRMVQSARWVGSWQIWQVAMWWCLKNRWIEIAFTKICNASKLWWPYQAVNFNDNTVLMRSHLCLEEAKGLFSIEALPKSHQDYWKYRCIRVLYDGVRWSEFEGSIACAEEQDLAGLWHKRGQDEVLEARGEAWESASCFCCTRREAAKTLESMENQQVHRET